MSEQRTAFDKLLNKTSKASPEPAILALEDGTVLRGFSCGAPGEVSGEICFNTGLVGYLEVITDPSYAGQIVTMTYPQIGNYGVNLDDEQAASVAMRGLVVRDMCTHPSNWRSRMSLSKFLRDAGVVAIEGVDTRALVRHIRERGAMRAVLSTVDLDAESLVAKARGAEVLGGENFVAQVSRADAEPYHFTNIYAFAKDDPAPARFRVVAYDCGVKNAILDGLVEAGCEVTVVPWDTPAEDVLALEPDGVFLSNGPGDPDTVEGTYAQVESLLGKVPIFGICLGHQMLGKAAGAQIEKLKYGHRGINHPVMNLLTKRVEITVQNHGYSIVFPSLGPLESESIAALERAIESEAQANEAAATKAEAVCESEASAKESAAAKPEAFDGADWKGAHDLREWTHVDAAPVVENDRFGRIQLTHVNLNDGTIEGMRFLDVPAFSVQYHPEAAPGSTDSQYLFTAFTRLMDEWKNGGAENDYLEIDRASDRLQGWRFGAEDSAADNTGNAKAPGQTPNQTTPAASSPAGTATETSADAKEAAHA